MDEVKYYVNMCIPPSTGQLCSHGDIAINQIYKDRTLLNPTEQ